MVRWLTIGAVAQQTGVPARTIRFYEAQGLLPPPRRTGSGYRLYSPQDVRRIRLVRQLRLLGLSLPKVQELAGQAFASTCSDYAMQVFALIEHQRAEIARQICELEALQNELDHIEAHVRHAWVRALPGQRVAECAYCPLIDEPIPNQEGGES